MVEEIVFFGFFFKSGIFIENVNVNMLVEWLLRLLGKEVRRSCLKVGF